MSELELSGLNGGNLLAFLAAVGTFRMTNDCWPDDSVRLSWRLKGVWRPVLSLPFNIDSENLVETLYRLLSERVDALEFNWSKGQKLNVTVSEFREVLIKGSQMSTPENRTLADWCASFGIEALTTNTDEIEKTPFYCLSGQQKFFDIVKQLIEQTTMAQIKAALFNEWSYTDPKPSFRWDPADDRRHAYRWDDPSSKNSNYPILTMRGANRLALEALPCFPIVPNGKVGHTTAFNLAKANSISWPIWNPAISFETLRSLLSYPELVQKDPSMKKLVPLGISEVFRSNRIIGQQYYANFTPAVPCMR